MGMFDYVQVEVPLPDGYRADDFQTKTFWCNLDTYRLAPDRRLYLDSFSFYLDDKGALRSRRDGWVEYTNLRGEPITGSFNFYDWDHDQNEWHEYVAIFENGLLKEIVVDEITNERYQLD